MANQVRGPLTIKVDATSNGEFRPVPLTEPVARANSEAKLRIREHAKRVGLGRRAFLQSLCGARAIGLPSLPLTPSPASLVAVPRGTIRGTIGGQNAKQAAKRCTERDRIGESGIRTHGTVTRTTVFEF
jgi:hypothetical protein